MFVFLLDVGAQTRTHTHTHAHTHIHTNTHTHAHTRTHMHTRTHTHTHTHTLNQFNHLFIFSIIELSPLVDLLLLLLLLFQGAESLASSTGLSKTSTPRYTKDELLRVKMEEKNLRKKQELKK